MAKKKIKVRAGHGSIFPNKAGTRYKAEIMVDGQRLRRWCDTEEEAQRYLEDAVRRSYRHGMSLDKGRTTFRQFAQVFLEQRELQGVKKTTLQDYGNTIACCNAIFGDVPLAHIAPEHINRLLSSLKAGGLRVIVRKTVWELDPAIGKKVKQLKEAESVKAAYSRKSLHNVHGAVHAILRAACQMEILDRNVVDKVPAPKVSEEEHKAWDTPTLQRFLSGIEGRRTEAMMWVFTTTGIRRGELVGLRWDDIDLTTGDITIRRRILRLSYGGGLDIDTPKSKSSRRVVSLPPPALEKLRQWRRRQQLEHHAHEETWKDEGWVFTYERTGRYWEPHRVNQELSRVIQELGLPYIPVHGLRHTFATWLLSNNVPIRDVSEVLGHSRASVTLNTYYQSIPGAGKRVSAKVGELLDNSPTIPPTGTQPLPFPKQHKA